MTTFGGQTIPPLFKGPSGVGLNIQFISTVDAWVNPTGNGTIGSMTLVGDTVTQQSANMNTGFQFTPTVPASGVWSYTRWTRTFSLSTGVQIGESSATHSLLLNLGVGNLINVQNTNDVQLQNQANSNWNSSGVVGANPVTQGPPGVSFFVIGDKGLQSTAQLLGGNVYIANGDHVTGPSYISKYSSGIAAVENSSTITTQTMPASIHGVAGDDGLGGNIFGWRFGDINGLGGGYQVIEYAHGLGAILSTNILPDPAAFRHIDPIRIFLGQYVCDAKIGVPMQVYDAFAANAVVGTIPATANSTASSIPIHGAAGERYLFFPAIREIWQVIG